MPELPEVETIVRELRADVVGGEFVDVVARNVNFVSLKCDLCYVCGGVVMKTRVAGRGTFYCEKCQKGG